MLSLFFFVKQTQSERLLLVLDKNSCVLGEERGKSVSVVIIAAETNSPYKNLFGKRFYDA